MMTAWPTSNTVHAKEQHWPGLPGDKWDDPQDPKRAVKAGPYCQPFRTCNYCGSMHPEDLLKAIERGGVTLEVADWKYGYPHKIYVNGIPNPIAGQLAPSSMKYVNGEQIEMKAPAPKTVWAKFYTVHLIEAGVPDQPLRQLLAKLTMLTNLKWYLGANSQLMYGPKDR